MALIDLAAPPFAGHLHPILGIARRLARDYDVRVISTARAQPEIAASGLQGISLLAGADDAIRAIADPPRAVRSHPLRLHAQLRANLALLDRFRVELRQLWERQRPDLLIADFTLPVAGSLARELGIPWWTTHPSPCVIETPDGPPAYLGGWRSGRGPLGRLRDAAGRALIRTFKRGIHRLYRRQITQLGFPRLYRHDGSEAVYSDERILATGLPELEFPRRWPSAVELVGPILYTPPQGSSCSAAPEPPFVPGHPHVLVTLGTHLAFRKQEMAAAARRAARALPHLEIHFSDGETHIDRGGDDERREPRVGGDSEPNFHRLAYVSYARHLARYALVVHHGGAGVMYHTLAAGLPALVVPVDYDQFDHAARLEAAGLARRLRRPADLAMAISAALVDPELRAACQRFQEIVTRSRAEERVAQLVAVRVVAARVGRGPRRAARSPA